MKSNDLHPLDLFELAAGAYDRARPPLPDGSELLSYAFFNSEASGAQAHGALFRYKGSVRLALAFRGSKGWRDWLFDLFMFSSVLRINQKTVVEVHSGCRTAWETIKPHVLEFVRSAPHRPEFVDFTGHSLGGQLAEAASEIAWEFDSAVTLTTFGAPAYGDEAYAVWAFSLPVVRRRYVAGWDFAANSFLHELFGYVHVGREIKLGGGFRYLSHLASTYRKRLRERYGNDA